MDFQPAFLVFSPFIFLLLLLVTVYKKKIKGRSLVQKLPPGPWKLPLIGNLHQLASSSSLPHHSLRDLSLKYGPLMHLQLGEISTIVVSSPDMAKEIMKTYDISFVQRPELLCPKILLYDSTDIAFAPYGDYWRQMKKNCKLELLSPKRVQSFSSIREDEVAKLIHSIRCSASAGSQVNLTKEFFSLVNTFVTRTAFGKKLEHADELLALFNEGSELMGGFDLADLFPSLKPIHVITRMKAKIGGVAKNMDMILDNIVKEHQLKLNNHGKGEETAAEENLVDVLLRVQQSGSLGIPITLNNIKAIIADVFIAGTDTSSRTLEWAMSELMKYPRVRGKAQAEIREAFMGKKIIKESDLSKLSYLKLVIKETLRLHPAGPLLLPRECREKCEIGGYEIHEKTKVIVNAWALGRDPKNWYEAEKFIPERFHGTNFDFKGNNFEYIPFGSGRRMCPGISVALASIELPLAALLFHFNWELPNGMKPEDLDMTESFGVTVGKRNNLYLIPTTCYI